MRKHTTARAASSAAMPIAGAVLAAAAAVLLGGCTPSATSAASQSATATTASATSATETPTGSGSGASATGSAASTGGAHSAPTCSGTQLSLSTSQDSAAGLFDYIVLEFVNNGSSACTIEGYPGAAAWGVTGSNYALNSTRQLTGNVGDQYTSPAPITLAHGATASTILEWIDKPTAGHPYADCLRHGAGSFGITAPNTTQTTHISLPADVCSAILVHPLVPGTTGRQPN
jgi:hypothetical protein